MGNTVGRLQTLFSLHQLDVMIGSLLGDARLECRSSGKRYPVSARLRIHQGEKQKDYVFWKYEILRDLVSTSPRRIKAGYDKKRQRTDYSWYFHTRTTQELWLLHQMFYVEEKKIVPKCITKLLTPYAIAVWFMDDGSNTKESYTLNTHSFSVVEQQKLTQILQEKYNIRATLVKDRSSYKMRIGRHEYQKFNSIIEPFVPPTMRYKICNPRNDFILV